jgi:hypothetical protein
MSYSTTLKPMNTPSDSMKEYYGNLFKRNQMKFMRRSPLEPSHLGSEFTIDGIQYYLVGTISPAEMIIENLEDGSCYIIHCDYATRLVLDN